MRNLHQLNLFRTRLVVEFAKDKNSTNNEQLDLDKDKFYTQLHFISSKFNIKYPISPLLKYNYPAASTSIIRNIAKSLFNLPAFYTQVLHLMNKMNLPPPFINTDYEFNEQFLPKDFNCKIIDLNSESSESEIDEGKLEQIKNEQLNKPKKRKIKKYIEKASKKRKSNACNELNDRTPSIQSEEMVNECFHNYVSLKRNQMQINKLDLNKKNKDVNETDKNGFGQFTNQTSQAQNETPNKETINQPVKLLFERKLTLEELNSCSVFSNYTIGESSCRLYIKNIDKKVTEEQLKTIFIHHLDLNTEIKLNQFDCNLFKKGKMNGQAFVNLSNEQLAKEAIDKTNGLLINKKPIVVCFARSIKMKSN